MSVPDSTEVLVIGGGPGGYVAAIRCGQLGLDVALVEAEAVGGVCLNHGCIPSKALISTVERVHEAGHMEDRGVYADPYVEFGELMDWKDGVVEGMTGGVGQLLDAAGVTVVDGRATFVDENTAAVESEPGRTGDEPKGDHGRIAFEHAIVATGSRPIEVPGFPFEEEPVLSSREALALDDPPESLVVIGGGYIGMELSTVYAKLGTDVTVVEMLESALPAYEDDVASVVRRRAEELGIGFQFGESAAGWSRRGEGIVVETESADGQRAAYEASAVLVAVGREPVAETVDPDAAGIELTDHGFIETDEFGRTSTADIYAVGDVVGEPMLAHEASASGVAVAETISGSPTSVDPTLVPAAVFTDPEIATVGYTAETARDRGHEVATGRFPFSASGRAKTAASEDGFVRLVVDATDGRVLGAQIVGEHASELIAELGLAVRAGLDATTVLETVHAHPTLAEALKEACEDALGRAIHVARR